VAFAALAGRSRGRMFDPERVTAVRDWHVERGAVFEDVGQWKRPRYYPRGGGAAEESMEAAVLRECAACVAESAFSMVPLLARSTCRGRTQVNSSTCSTPT
jgi:hypothetical protein